MKVTGLWALLLIACGGQSKPQPTGPASGSNWDNCYYDRNCKQGSAAPAASKDPYDHPDDKAAAPAPKASGPVGDKAADLREAADLLDKAAAQLAAGSKSRADELFSRAELITGTELVAAIAPAFRDGAPPRITTPTIKVAPGPAQPKVVGSSEQDDAEDKIAPPRVEGSLTGVVMIDGKPLAGTYGLVTLEPASGRWRPRTPKHRVIEQRLREFRPHIMAVPVGSTIAFPNFDTVFHNVFSTSPLGAFDLGLYKTGEAREFTFDKEGIVRLGCNLHANMSAYIAVVAAPAYVVTDDSGKFAFKHLEPGKYRLKAWSEKTKTPIEKDVTIKVGPNDVSVGVAADAPAGPTPDKFGGKRG
jgi:plastocyanin